MVDTIDNIFRDYETPFVPESGDHEPIKADIRAKLNQMEAAIVDVKRQSLGDFADDAAAEAYAAAYVPPIALEAGLYYFNTTANMARYYTGSGWVFSVGPGYIGTSATSLTIGPGSQSFSTQAGLAYGVGSRVRIASTADVTKYMDGVVTAYDPMGTAMTVNVDGVNGSGIFASWSIGLVGAPGPALGINWTSNAIRVRSTANVTLASGLTNGTTLNGVVLATGNYVFLGSQTAPAENGLYTVVASGAASRASFADSAAELARIGFVIQAGTVGAGEGWTLGLDAGSINLGTTALNFSPVQGGPSSEVISARGGYSTLGTRMDFSEAAAARAAAKQAFFTARYQRELSLPQALLHVWIGQSNHEPRDDGTGTAPVTGITHPNAYMPVGGNGGPKFDYFATNQEWCVDWNEVSSVVIHQEDSSREGPGGGFAAAFSDRGPMRRLYQVSVAVGGRDLTILGQGGPLANAHGMIRRLCAVARADGYRPVVSFSQSNGEAAMSAGQSETQYYTNGMEYLGLMQLYAAQQMGRPEYRAPIVMSYPQEMKDATSIDIERALTRILGDTPNAISIGPQFPYPSLSDRVHNTNLGMATRGEAHMLRLRRFFENGDVSPPVLATDVTWNGTTTCVIKFTQQLLIDTNFNYGANLNAANALYGMEWVDNGSYVKINAAVVSGNKITLTLNASPVGTVGQQRFRIAVPTTTVSLVSGTQNQAGTIVRKAGSGVISLVNPSYTHYDFACPQEMTVRAA